MKIILTTDVPKVGNRNEIKDLKDGYANTLIQKGVAQMATPKAIKELSLKKDQAEKKKEQEIKIFESMISSIDNKKIEIKAKANDKGHLFKAISPQEIVKAIKDITGIEIETNSIIISGHIKELGSHFIEIKKGGRKGKCEIVITDC